MLPLEHHRQRLARAFPGVTFEAGSSSTLPTFKVFVEGSYSGYMELKKISTDNTQWSRFRCKDEIEKLTGIMAVKGKSPKALYQVTEVYLQDPYLGRGIGKALYEHALASLARSGPIILFPSACARSTTTEEAKRVWKSLERSHLSVGDAVSSIRAL